MIAFLHPGNVAGAFMDSVCNTMMKEVRPGRLLFDGGGYINLQSGPRIAEARSQIVETFLTAPIYAPADWLFMVDSDMVFEADAMARLIEAADPVERPIMGGLCYAGYSPETAYPTVFSLIEEDGSWATEKVADFPRNAIVKVGATGAAFMVVHRNALKKMYEHFHLLPNGLVNNYPWFVEGHVDHKGRALGEDIAFCIRAQSIGIPVHIHTGVEAGHRKNIILTTETWDDHRVLEKLKADPQLYEQIRVGDYGRIINPELYEEIRLSDSDQINRDEGPA